MKNSIALSAFLALALLAGPAASAEGDQFVIRGEASKVMMEQNEINIATAEAVGRACVEEATKQGVRVSIAIYNQFGDLVYFYRMDGQSRIAITTAMEKAKTVLNTRQASKRTMNDVESGRTTELRQVSHGNFANSGGLPIVMNGNQIIGAIGVGGSSPNPPVWSDEICAWRAMTKVIGPQPALLPDLPRARPERAGNQRAPTP